MSVVDLARLQFAGTIGIHWLFVLLTLGLVPVVAVLHTAAVRSGDPARRSALERATRFWGQLYVINYALGIVTGLVMEFQFGLAWSGLSKFAGNVIGAPVALETLVAFFAESTFLGMWIFGWGRLAPRLHAALIWLVVLTAYASAYFIMVANGFMQHPVGHEVRDGVAYLTDLGAMLTNPNALLALGHITAAALLTGGLFVAGVSAYHVARQTAERPFFVRSLRWGVGVAAFMSVPAFLLGALQYPLLGETQPMKLAVLEGGEEVARVQEMMAARYGAGNYVPPSWLVSAQNVMLYLGYVTAIVALTAALVVFRARLVRSRVVAVLVAVCYPLVLAVFVGGLLYGEPGPNMVVIYVVMVGAVTALLVHGAKVARWRRAAWLLVAVTPLPFVASLGGWLFREIGRQPWIVYGELTVEQAVSPVSAANVWASFVAFMVVFVGLAVTNWVLIARFAARGPDGVHIGRTEPVRPSADEPVPTF